MDAIRLLGGILESNAIGGQVLGELLRRAEAGDALAGVIGLFAPGTIASGLAVTDSASSGLLPTLAAGGAPPMAHESQDEAILLIQALCSAAKADGALSNEARSTIVSKVVGITDEAAAFLDGELEAPLDMRALAGRAPESIAHHIYAFSMMGLPRESRQQVQYLSAVAQGLGVDWIAAKKIHAELGGPSIFG